MTPQPCARIYSVYIEKGQLLDSSEIAANMSLQMAPALIQQMMLAHKYSMTNTVSDLKATICGPAPALLKSDNL